MSDEYLKARQNETVRLASYLMQALSNAPPRNDVGIDVSALMFSALEITSVVSTDKIDRDRKLDELASEIRKAVNIRKREPFKHALERFTGGAANDR